VGDIAPELRYRPDIQGLRAVAVLLVVLDHAGVTLLAGGYIGVDVFFVLSGFLITGLLLSDHSERGRIRFLNFYSRRARRILPASCSHSRGDGRRRVTFDELSASSNCDRGLNLAALSPLIFDFSKSG